MRVKNKKIRKLRLYRDKLLVRVTNLEGMVRHANEVMWAIRKALQDEDHLRAYALASDEEGSQHVLRHVKINEVVKELALVYRFLIVERKFTLDIHRAAEQRDYLRVAAICANHKAEEQAHENMLSRWSTDHGFTNKLREEGKDEMVT